MSIKSWAAHTIHLVIASVLINAAFPLCADEIQMQNGDRYFGRLVALTNDTLIVQSELLGTIRVPRAKVAGISLGAVTGTNSFHPAAPTVQPQRIKAPMAKVGSQLPTTLGQLQTDTNAVHQVQQQFLGEAGPEANKKFTELADGLMSGKMSLSDLRAQAGSAADQLRALKREGGGDLGGSLDGYLEILENFLKETPAPLTSVTNRQVQVRKSPQTPPSDEE